MSVETFTMDHVERFYPKMAVEIEQRTRYIVAIDHHQHVITLTTHGGLRGWIQLHRTRLARWMFA